VTVRPRGVNVRGCEDDDYDGRTCGIHGRRVMEDVVTDNVVDDDDDDDEEERRRRHGSGRPAVDHDTCQLVR